MQQISVVTLHELLAKDSIEHLIDVRSPEEFADVRHACDQVRNVPLDRITSLDLPKDATIYVSCLSGARSAAAQQKLATMGYRKVVNVMGGIKAWIEAGYPIAKGGSYR